MSGRAVVAAGAGFVLVGALTLPMAASARPPHAEPERADQAVGVHPPDRLTVQSQATKMKALDALLDGTPTARTRSGSTGVMVDGQLTETGVTGEDEIFVLLTEFGDEVDPRYGGDPGPLHNQIAEPDRALDNSTIWQPDYDPAHYERIFAETADDAVLSVANYVEEQSSDKYTVTADVTDWLRLPYNGARYGSNLDHPETHEAWVTDSLNAWWEASCAGGGEDACSAELAAMDQRDRYDYDGDGIYTEPDGYLDRLHIVHAGVAEETGGGGVLGTDAIETHAARVNPEGAGFEGPSVPGGGANLNGGVQIGDSPIWAGNYVAVPENGGQGVFAQYVLRDLGLPLEYATDGVDNDTGFWTLMSQGRYLSQEDKDQAAIGDRAGALSAWDKAFLGWITPEDGSLYVAEEGEQEVTLGAATPRTGELPQAAVVNLPDRDLVVDTQDPWAGELSWWSTTGNDLLTSLTTAEPLDLSGATSASVTMKTAYDLEEGFDYVFAEVSTDGGASWERPSGTVDGEPIWTGDELQGLTGSSDVDGDGAIDWVDLQYDLADWAGSGDVLFRLVQDTDQFTFQGGFYADDIAIAADGEIILSDDVESPESSPWIADGFVAAGAEYVQTAPQRYWIENRQLSGADATLDDSPYNFSYYDRPALVEFFAYQTGPLLWYSWDAYQDNNVGSHPGVGLNLPIDVHPEALLWDDDNNPATSDVMRTRIQVSDATLSLEDTPRLTLHRTQYDDDGNPVGYGETSVGQLDEVTTFDDIANTYWYESFPNHGVLLEPTGTQVELLSQDHISRAQEVSSTLRILAPAGPTPTPTPTDTPTATPTTTSSPSVSPTVTVSPTATTGQPTPTGTLPGTGGGKSVLLIGLGLAAVVLGGLAVAIAGRRLRREE